MGVDGLLDASVLPYVSTSSIAWLYMHSDELWCYNKGTSLVMQSCPELHLACMEQEQRSFQTS